MSESSRRMTEIVTRMQRFTNLDRAEIHPVDLNQLLSDVAALEEAHHGGRVKIRVEFGNLPLIPCRPQPLSAIFSGLVHKAAANAGTGGEVEIRTIYNDPEVMVAVRDSGARHTPQELSRMFDPAFRVSSGRVTTGDWNLFSSRRLLEQEGGSIRAESNHGGTEFLVTIPCLAGPL